MGQVTIYLDEESEKRLRAAAKAAGKPLGSGTGGGEDPHGMA